jgi:SAM-dependent methyltransferase
METKHLKALKSLSDKELDAYQREIRPLNPAWKEYANQITDYGVNKVAVTNRYLQPYLASELHGKDIFDGLVELVKDLGVKTVVDLGCGAGEFLSKLPPRMKRYGLTIDVGEVKYARKVFKLDGVVPADMRDVDKYFRSMDMVLAHRSFDFITDYERVELMAKIHRVLKPGGYFVHVDDERFPESVLPEWDHRYYKEVSVGNYRTKGKLTVLQNVQ